MRKWDELDWKLSFKKCSMLISEFFDMKKTSQLLKKDLSTVQNFGSQLFSSSSLLETFLVNVFCKLFRSLPENSKGPQKSFFPILSFYVSEILNK